MKAFRYNKLMGMAAGFMLAASLTSCVQESADEISSAKSNGRLTLNITSAPVGTQTRAVTNLNSTTAQGTTKSDGEKTINRLVMAVYDNSDSYALLMGKSVSSASGTSYSATENFATGGLESGDSIVVAANIPSTKLATYAAYTPMSNFIGATLSIQEALTPGTAGTLSASDLPMFGKGVVAATATDGEFTADITLRHLVAKVALNSLSCDFSATAHPDATFEPTELFLINVPENIDMQVTASGGYQYRVANTDFYQGEANSWTAHANADQRQFADYLGTGALGEAALEDGDALTNKYWLYTLPNNDATYQTKLVIKGTYSIDGTAARGHDAYYAVALGASTTDLRVEMNTVYNVSVTIKGDGAEDAYSAIPGYQEMTATIDTEDWSESGSVVTAGTGGMSYSGVPTEAPVVGDLYFSDGTWGTAAEYPDKTPIGIVFSTTTSDTDQAAGYKRGYVMALTNVIYNNTLAAPNSWILTDGWCIASKQSTQVTSTLYTTLAAVQGDLDGRTHCEDVKTYCATPANGVELSDMYAVNAAITTYQAQVPAPVSTEQLPNSGWYLPSIGQQYQWLIGLGGLPAGTAWTAENASPIRYWYLANPAATTWATAINNTLTNAGLVAGTTYDAFRGIAGEYFWSSSERTAANPFNLHFLTSGALYLSGGTDKSNAYRQVRAVLAF